MFAHQEGIQRWDPIEKHEQVAVPAVRMIVAAKHLLQLIFVPVLTYEQVTPPKAN
jgi:hypothetical protein